MTGTDSYYPDEVITYRWLVANQERQWSQREHQLAKEYLEIKRRHRDKLDSTGLKRLKHAKEIIRSHQR